MKKEMLGCSTLHKLVYDYFSKISDTSKRTCPIKLVDVLMSGYAVFSLKFPSLLQFDTSISDKSTKPNIQSIFYIGRPPSDTQMRERYLSNLKREHPHLYASQMKMLDFAS